MSDNFNNINIRDLEDMVLAQQPSAPLYGEASKGVNPTSTRPGSFINPRLFEAYAKSILSQAQRTMGQGRPENSLQTFYSRIDRNGNNPMPLPAVNKGFTFITRPRLNLSTPNLRQSTFLAGLDSYDQNSVPFMIRALLDTCLSKGNDMDPYYGIDATPDQVEFGKRAAMSPLLDIHNPFFVPICNALKGISGFPDFTLETTTTEGDYHGGDFTFARGSDFNMRTQELSLEFRDIRGCSIMMMFYYWITYIALQTKGIVISYPDDIYEQRLNYTVSIYRFVTDTTRKNILQWSKATGCFPVSVPVGSGFNTSQDEVTVSAFTNFSIPFKANVVEYNEPGILEDFNALMMRYCRDIDKYADLDFITDENGIVTQRSVEETNLLNYVGLPYIVSEKETGLRLSWRAPAEVLALQSDEVQQSELFEFQRKLIEAQEKTYKDIISRTRGENQNVQG